VAEQTDFELDAVTSSARCGFWSLFVVMMGFTFFSASMWVGVKLANGLSFGRFVLAVMAGNLILSAYCSLLAWQAAKTGLSIHLLSRYSFGSRGSAIPSAILAFTQVGWFGVGVAMFAIPTTVFLKDLGFEGSRQCLYILTAVSGVLMTLSAYYGIKALKIISVIAVPAIAVFGGWSAIRALFLDDPALIVANNAALAETTVASGWQVLVNHVPAVDAKTGASAAIGMMLAISMGIGGFVSGGSCTPDFARFAKNTRHAVVTTALAFFLGNSLMFFFGAAAAMVYGKSDISDVLKIQGLLLPAIIVLGLNIWTTNENALYSSGLGLSNITGLPRRWLVLFNGLLGTALAIWLYDNFCGWLNILNTVIPPCGAIVMADFFLLKKRDYAPIREAAFCPISLSAVIAWVGGSVVALGGFGYLPLGDWAQCGLPALNGMIVAAILYVLGKKLGLDARYHA